MNGMRDASATARAMRAANGSTVFHGVAGRTDVVPIWGDSSGPGGIRNRCDSRGRVHGAARGYAVGLCLEHHSSGRRRE